jgi:hypothetical protein
MYGGLAARLRIGNFLALRSLTIHEYKIEESAAAALIEALDRGCRAVTCLSLGSQRLSRDPAQRGVLLKTLSEASKELLHSLQTLRLHWVSLAPKSVWRLTQ